LEVFECIRTSRATRSYLDKEVPWDVIRGILEAGRLAPSSRNMQPWRFIVVRSRETLRRLASLTPTGSHIAGASFAIVVLTDPGIPLRDADGGRAVQNMVLAAWEKGVGSCWVSNVDGGEARPLLSIPPEWSILAVVPFGYPAEPRTARKKDRKPLEEVVSLERFGERVR